MNRAQNLHKKIFLTYVSNNKYERKITLGGGILENEEQLRFKKKNPQDF